MNLPAVTKAEFIRHLAAGVNPAASLTDSSPTGQANPSFIYGGGSLISISSFKRDKSGNFARRNKTFSSLQAIIIDDYQYKVKMHKINVEPSALIETSKDKFQAYFFLKEPITDFEKAYNFMDYLIKGGVVEKSPVPSQNGLLSLGFLPNSRNRKFRWETKLVSWNPDLRYTTEQLMDFEMINSPDGQNVSNEEFIKHMSFGIPAKASLTSHSFSKDPSTGGNWTAYKSLEKRLIIHNNNYISVSAFSITDGQVYRRRMNFVSLQAVMIDDLGTKLPMSDLKLKPTALIETSPGNFQAYLFLKEPITDVNYATSLIDAMVDSGISSQNDPGMRGVTRVGRLPVGKNTKAKYGEPFPSKVHEWNPDVRYSPEEIIQAYELILQKPRGGGRPTKRVTNGWDWIIDYIKSETNYYIAEMRPQYHRVICPWWERHTDGGKTGTYYIEPSDENKGFGGFICHHGSCSDFKVLHFNSWVSRHKFERYSKCPIPDFITQEY